MAIFLKDQTKPDPIPNACCPRCNSKRLIQGQQVKEYSDGIPSSLALEVPTGQKVLFGLGRDKVEYAWVYVNLCVDCGFMDWFMKKQDAEALWEIYKNNL